MSEYEPMHLEMHDGSDFEATRDNTSLFRHLGKYAIYDHVFIVTNEEESRGTYVFSVHHTFEQMANYMAENRYPMHLNLTEAAQCDIDAWERMIQLDVESDGDFVPEEWQDGEA